MNMPLSKDEELERILATFRHGKAMCASALYTLMYAVITLLLVVTHILTFLINFTVGVLTCLYGGVCMARLLLVLLQERAVMGPHSAVIGIGRRL